MAKSCDALLGTGWKHTVLRAHCMAELVDLFKILTGICKETFSSLFSNLSASWRDKGGLALSALESFRSVEKYTQEL